MIINLLNSALDELVDGYWFYEKQRSGLGQYFLDNLYSDIGSLALNPGIHPIFYNKYNRLLSKRFPFAIYYRVENNMVNVYAILDCRKNPAWLRKKLK